MIQSPLFSISHASDGLERNGWTQKELAKEVKISRSTLNQLLTAQPVKFDTIENLCDLLELEIGQILEPIASSDDLEALVRRLRSQGSASIQKRCGEMRVLDMTTPIGLGSIYTDVNILERLASKTRRDLGELMNCGSEEFDRVWLGKVREERVDGLEADHDRVLTEIRSFAENYSDNHIVITCRIAARDYIFQQFTEVEVADFSGV